MMRSRRRLAEMMLTAYPAPARGAEEDADGAGAAGFELVGGGNADPAPQAAPFGAGGGEDLLGLAGHRALAAPLADIDGLRDRVAGAEREHRSAAQQHAPRQIMPRVRRDRLEERHRQSSSRTRADYGRTQDTMTLWLNWGAGRQRGVRRVSIVSGRGAKSTVVQPNAQLGTPGAAHGRPSARRRWMRPSPLSGSLSCRALDHLRRRGGHTRVGHAEALSLEWVSSDQEWLNLAVRLSLVSRVTRMRQGLLRASPGLLEFSHNNRGSLNDDPTGRAKRGRWVG